LTNALIAGNRRSINGEPGGTERDVFGAVTGRGNLIGVSSGLAGIVDGTDGNHAGTAAVPIDPKLGPLQDNGGPTPTLAPLPGSPALDAGVDAASTTDQRGGSYLRKYGAAVDAGAYEVQNPALSVALAAVQKAVVEGGTLTLTLA